MRKRVGRTRRKEEKKKKWKKKKLSHWYDGTKKNTRTRHTHTHTHTSFPAFAAKLPTYLVRTQFFWQITASIIEITTKLDRDQEKEQENETKAKKKDKRTKNILPGPWGVLARAEGRGLAPPRAPVSVQVERGLR